MPTVVSLTKMDSQITFQSNRPQTGNPACSRARSFQLFKQTSVSNQEFFNIVDAKRT